MKPSLTSIALLASQTYGVAATPSAGCGKAPSKVQNGINTANVNGVARPYIVRLPDNYDEKVPYRVVFTFHATGGSASSTAKRYEGALAAGVGNTSILVSPQGQTPKLPGSQVSGVASLIGGITGSITGWWRTGGKYGDEDIQFVDKIIEDLDANLCVNTSLRFATGFSFGGVISYSLACSRGDKFRAVSVRSGGNFDSILGSMGGKNSKASANACKSTDGLTSKYGSIDAGSLIGPVLLGGKQPGQPLVCGNTPVAYMGSMGLCDGWVAYGRDAKDDFVKNNGCQPKVAASPVEGSKQRAKTTYECKADYPVVWTEFDGAHAAQREDEVETWKFFEQFT